MMLRHAVAAAVAIIAVTSASAQTTMLLFGDSAGVFMRWAGVRAVSTAGYRVERRCGDGDWLPVALVTPVTSNAAIRAAAGARWRLALGALGIADTAADLDPLWFNEGAQREAIVDIAAAAEPGLAAILGEAALDTHLQDRHHCTVRHAWRVLLLRIDGSSSIIASASESEVTREVPATPTPTVSTLDARVVVAWPRHLDARAVGTIVERAESVVGPFTRLTDTPVLPSTVVVNGRPQSDSLDRFVDITASPGRTFYYRTRHINAFGVEGPPSVSVGVDVGWDQRARLLGITATPYGGGLMLHWELVDRQRIDRIEVWRRYAGDATFVRIHPLSPLETGAVDTVLDLDAGRADACEYAISLTSAGQTVSDTLYATVPDAQRRRRLTGK
jgi:hypothetical protein